MKSDFLLSLRRTLVPIVVGALGATVFASHINPDDLEAVVGGLISGVYYAIFRFVELKFPWFGILLGAKKQPVYVAPEA